LASWLGKLPIRARSTRAGRTSSVSPSVNPGHGVAGAHRSRRPTTTFSGERMCVRNNESAQVVGVVAEQVPSRDGALAGAKLAFVPGFDLGARSGKKPELASPRPWGTTGHVAVSASLSVRCRKKARADCGSRVEHGRPGRFRWPVR